MRLFFFTLESNFFLMIKNIIRFFIFFLTGFQLSHAAPINALALKNGCRIVQRPATFFTPTAFSARIDAWSVYALQDESETSGWCSGAASRAPYVFVFELSEDYSIKKLAFNTRCQKEYKLISAKDIKVEYSITSAKTGFISPATYSLKQDTINTFDCVPVKARWIKLTILSNHGNPQWTELMEFEALGDPVNPAAPVISPVGVWNTDFEWVSINKTTDGIIYGCYKWANGEMYLKKQNRNKYVFTWKQNDDGQKGWCVLVMNKEGTSMSGIWGVNNDTTKFGHWEFTRLQNAPYKCSNDLTVAARIKEEALAAEPKLNVMIEVVDKVSNKAIPGIIDLYTIENFYQIPSGDGMYTADVKVSSRVVVKTFLPDYYPSIDTFVVSEAEQKRLYVTRMVQLSKLKAGSTILLQNLLFARTSAELSPSSYTGLDQLVTVMNQYPSMIIELSGHTDNVGSAKQNLDLSKKRVEAAKKYLVDKGINPDRIKGVGYGSKYPVASNDSEQTRKLNRRVELRIITM